MFDGWCASRGVDPLTLPIDRLLNLVYFWLVDGKTDRRRYEIDSDLERVPAGETQVRVADSRWSAAAEMAEFRRSSTG